jgi:hypothetical protein
MSDRQSAPRLRSYFFRIGSEAVLIIASVFVAILLESMWQDRAERQDAREALAQVRTSLAEDRVFFDRVEQEQRDAAERIELLIRWFSNPVSPPGEDVLEALDYQMPISIWPRRAAWNTMVSAGQLQLLGAPDLTTRIGDYYEHHLRRIEYNGRQYDDAFIDIFEGDLPGIWNFEQREPLTADPARLAEFQNRLLQLYKWIEYYLASVETNRRLLETLIEDIDNYLREFE